MASRCPTESGQVYHAHVVSHTHWDREWYRTFEAFRVRLVALTDTLLDLLERDPDYGPYYFDGQMRPIEDYIEVCPHQTERLKRAFEEGRIYSGPWYVQPDEFLVSGEALIRNLLMGRRTAREWGTEAKVGYAPDAFGHTAQIPQILRGFGIDNAVLFRGITADQVGSEFNWRSPDGSEVLCIKMPDDNAYSNWFYRFRETLADTDRKVALDADRVIAEATALLEDSIRERPATPHILWMDGVDHILPQPRTPEMIRLINRRMGDRVHVRTSRLDEFVACVREARPDLPVVTGELRVANRAWKLQALLAHVASSRIHLKQRNHACETLLERWAEPWSAIAWAMQAGSAAGGGPATGGRWDARPFLRQAWKVLLLNHPHDSICGCSIDQVHRDMLPRFDQVEQIGELIVAWSLQTIADMTDTWRVATDRHDPEPICALVVFNPLGWERRSEEVTATALVPTSCACETLGVYRGDDEIPARVEPLPPCHTLDQAPHDIPVGHAWKRFRVTFRADVPALGVAVYHLAPKTEAMRATGERQVARVGSRSIENGRLRIEAHDNGTLTMTDLRTGRTYHGLLAFEDGGDHGDGYNYVPPVRDRVVRTTDAAPMGSDVAIQTELKGTDAVMRIEHRWFVPEGRDGDGRDETTQALVHIGCEMTLGPESSVIVVAITVENGARDHRLRVLCPSGAAEAETYAVEQAFCVVERPIRLPDCTGWKEKQPGTGPQKTFTDVSDAVQGLAVINKGLPESEVLDDSDRTIAVTLLRCTGQGVGLPEDQVEGQMIGRHEFRLALFPHVGDWRSARVWQAAHGFNVPLRAVQTGVHRGSIADGHSFIEVKPETLVLSAVKPTEDGEGIAVRAYSLADEPVEAQVRLNWTQRTDGEVAARLRRTRLDETPCDPSALVLPYEIVTLVADAS